MADRLDLTTEEQQVLKRALLKGVRIIDDQAQRDREWAHKLEKANDEARRERCRRTNLELDLQRLLDGDEPLNRSPVVLELQAALAQKTSPSQDTPT